MVISFDQFMVLWRRGSAVKKEWFILFSHRPKGPYDRGQIMQLWGAGTIGPEQLMWRNGMAHWLAFKDCEGLSELFPPEIPRGQTTALPPSPPPQLSRPELPASSAGSRRSRSSVAALLALIVAVGAWWILGDPEVTRPNGLPNTHFPQLAQVLEVSPEEKADFRFAFDSQANRLWIASNLQQTVPVLVQLQAIPGQVLHRDPIQCQAVGVIREHFLPIERFTFTRGSQLYPGRYQMTLSYIREGREYEISREIYLGPENEQEFAQKLETYQDSVNTIFTGLSSELQQRYSTLASLLAKTESLFEQRLRRMNRGGQVARFQRDYTASIGPFLTEFATDNFMRPNKIPTGWIGMKRQFTALFDLSRSLAGLSAEIVQTIGPKKQITMGKRRELQDLFSQKFHHLKSRLQFQERRAQTLKAFK